MYKVWNTSMNHFGSIRSLQWLVNCIRVYPLKTRLESLIWLFIWKIFFTLSWLLGLKIQFYRSLSHLGTFRYLQWLVNSILWRQYWNLKSGFISNLCFLLCDDLRMFRCSFYVSWPFRHSLIPPVARQLHPLEAALESQMWYYLWSIYLTRCEL